MDNNSIPEDWKNITDPALRRKARKKVWRKNNREKILTSRREYEATNKEKRKVWRKRYETSNKEKRKASRKKYYETNKEKYKIYSKKYYEANKEKILLVTKKYQKEYKNKEKASTYIKERRKINIQFKLTLNLRTRLYRAIYGNYKAGSAVRDLGCSIDELKVYLEFKFLPGMSWDNWTHDGWHIDHIKPLASFDLTDRNQLLQACHYTNLQPLWAKDNISKGDKIL